MKSNFLSLSMAFLFASIFFIFLITPSSIFNYIPYFIYHSLDLKIITEEQFIIFFDFVFSLIFFFLIFRLIKNLIGKSKT